MKTKRKPSENRWRAARRLFLALFIALAFAGCSNEIDAAIGKLGGTEAEQEEARTVISISAEDPLPKLKKALTNKKLSETARVNVAQLLGDQGEKRNDEAIAEPLIAGMASSEENVQAAILRALEKTPGDAALNAIKAALDAPSEAVSQEANNILSLKAEKLEKEADGLKGETATARKIELLSKAADVYPVSERLREKLAGYYAIGGQEDKAREIFNSGGAYVDKIKVLGPFPLEGEKGDYVDPGDIDYGKIVLAPDGSQREWVDFNEIGYNGVIDFRKSPHTKVSNSIYYVSFVIDSDMEREAEAKIYVRDKMRLWLNGEAIKPTEKPSKGEEGKIDISLKAGKNVALIKLGSKKYSRLSMRICDDGGKPIEGVGYSR